MSSRRAANYPAHCNTSEKCHSKINRVFHIRLVQVLLLDGLGWSSEKWSKASERATVALDQVRTRLPMSIPTSSKTTLGAMHIATEHPGQFGYLDNENHGLVESSGRGAAMDPGGVACA
jgi:hypothetical protein